MGVVGCLGAPRIPLGGVLDPSILHPHVKRPFSYGHSAKLIFLLAFLHLLEFHGQESRERCDRVLHSLELWIGAKRHRRQLRGKRRHVL